MSVEVRKKFEEFGKRLESDEDVFKLLDEMDAYMKGIIDSTNNQFTKSEVGGLMMDFMLLHGILGGLKATKEKFEKIDVKLNSILEKINKLEQKKPLDDPESMK